jgi:hypothetical protein
MDWFSELLQPGESALAGPSLVELVINLALVLILSQVLTWHYIRFAQVLSNKRRFSRQLVFIAATTMMVISVVKTSLALSLGLVGALSIIRFRTPIKEPEELAYLFLAIATGIGIGADQLLGTALMCLAILGYLALRGLGKPRQGQPRILAHVTVSLSGGEGGTMTPEAALKGLLERVGRESAAVDLRRVDTHEGVFDATLMLDLHTAEEIGGLLSAIEEALPGATVSVIESGGLD